MKKNVEMISLNLGSMNFEEKMDLDEVLERLNLVVHVVMQIVFLFATQNNVMK